MDTKPRLTKQGIRDLNYYGPKRNQTPAAEPARESHDRPMAPPIVQDEIPPGPVSLDA